MSYRALVAQPLPRYEHATIEVQVQEGTEKLIGNGLDETEKLLKEQLLEDALKAPEVVAIAEKTLHVSRKIDPFDPFLIRIRARMDVLVEKGTRPRFWVFQ